MKKTYEVAIKQSARAFVEVQAQSEIEAEEIAEEMVENGDLSTVPDEREWTFTYQAELWE